MPLITGVREDSYLYMNFDSNISGNVPGIVKNPGTANIDSNYWKMGTGAVRLSNTSIQLDTKAELFNFGINDFTIALWVYPTASMVNKALLTLSLNSATGTAGLVLGMGGANTNLFMSTNGQSYNVASSTPMGPALAQSTYTHVALCRSGNFIKAFINGVNTVTLGIGLYNPIYFNSSYPSYLGRYSNIGDMSGLIDEFLVINGKALYTENFSPPTDAYVVEASPYLTVDGYEFATTEPSERSSTKPSYDFSELDPLGDLTRKIKPVIRVEQLEGVGSLTRKTKSVIRVEQLEGVGDRVPGLRVLNKEPVMGLDTGLRDSIKLAYEFPSLESTDREPSIKSSFELEVFDFDTNLNNEFNLIVTPTHQHRDQVVHVKVTSTKVEAIMGKYRVLVGNTVVIPYGENNIDVRSLEFSINPSDLVPGVNMCKIEYSGDNSGYLQFKVTKEALKRELVERTFLSYDGGYKTENAVLSGSATAYAVKSESKYTVSSLGSGKKFVIKLGNYVEKVEVL